MRKLSENMREALKTATGGYGIIQSWRIPTGTAVALMDRGMLASDGRRYQVRTSGADAADVSMRDLIERAHVDALKENAEWLAHELRDAGRITDPNKAKFYAVGEYYRRGGRSYNLMVEVPQKVARLSLLDQAYAVDQPVHMAHCKRIDAHAMHVWSWLGPQPSHFCNGDAVA